MPFVLSRNATRLQEDAKGALQDLMAFRESHGKLKQPAYKVHHYFSLINVHVCIYYQKNKNFYVPIMVRHKGLRCNRETEVLKAEILLIL